MRWRAQQQEVPTALTAGLRGRGAAPSHGRVRVDYAKAKDAKC